MTSPFLQKIQSAMQEAHTDPVYSTNSFVYPTSESPIVGNLSALSTALAANPVKSEATFAVPTVTVPTAVTPAEAEALNTWNADWDKMSIAPATAEATARNSLNTWNDDWDHMSFGRVAPPVTRRRQSIRRTKAPNRRSSALTEAQIAANEAAMRATNVQPDPYGYTAEDVAAMHRFEQEHPNAIGRSASPMSTPVQPQFSNDDLAVYDWQTGKPKTDIFGFQIRSADPRDHIGDPRWGTITQDMINNYR